MTESNVDSLLLSESTDDGVLVLSLNDPSTRNALGPELRQLLMDAVRRFARDDDLRVLVLTGSGSAFCSGANVGRIPMREADSDAGDDNATAAGRPQSRPGPWETLDPVYSARATGDVELGPQVVGLLHNLEKPSIAAVNGAAYGLGCGIAMSCDFRIAARSARFSEVFVRRGLVPGAGSTWLLPKLVGLSEAMWMQFTGDPVDSGEAFRIGLVNRIVEDGSLMTEAIAMATKLAKGPIFTMGLIKQLIHQSYEQDFPDHLSIVSRAQDVARASDDHKEGVRAFMEKREPKFVGH